MGEQTFEAIKPMMDKAFRGQTVSYWRYSKNAQGEKRFLELVYVPHIDKHGNCLGYFSLGIDATEKRKARQEEMHRNKLKAVIETAGSVCHRLNQPLQTILMESDIVFDQKELPDQTSEALEIIKTQIDTLMQLSAKLANIITYETEKYSDSAVILDLDKSSSPQ